VYVLITLAFSLRLGALSVATVRIIIDFFTTVSSTTKSLLFFSLMSSLRNSLHRRNHKERSQLAHRARFGILEKHKDYVLRAKDYHSKQDRIRTLQRKAAGRNKDEFYFGMVNQRTNEGVHIQSRGNVAMPVDMVKVLKTQDENYVRTMRSSNAKKIDRIKSQLSTMADLVREDGGVDEEELPVLEKSGVLASRKLKGKARSMSGPKHVVFVEEGEEGLFSLILCCFHAD